MIKKIICFIIHAGHSYKWDLNQEFTQFTFSIIHTGTCRHCGHVKESKQVFGKLQ